MKTRISSYLLNGSTGCLSRTYNRVYYVVDVMNIQIQLFSQTRDYIDPEVSYSIKIHLCHWRRITRYLPVQTTRPEMLKRGFGREDSIILDNSSLPNNSTWQTYTNTNSWCEVTRHNIASIHGWTFWCKVIRQWNVCVEVCRLPAYWRVHSLEKRYAD